MNAFTEDIYEKIQAVARDEKTIPYGKLALAVGLLTGRDPKLHRALDAINRREHAEGRPLISAVTVLASEGIPGEGFFTIAQELGRFDPSRQGKHDYWRWERDEVYRQWG